MRVIMKHLSIYKLIATALLSLALLAACSSEEQTYDGPSYVMFTDSLNVCPVFQENNDYKVALSATKVSLTTGNSVLKSSRQKVMPLKAITIPSSRTP